MKLKLQFGYGMKGLSEHLADVLPGTSVVLSPRDIDQDKAMSFASKMRKNGGSVLLDPQVYALSGSQDLKVVPKYDFWQHREIKNIDWAELVKRIHDINLHLESEVTILPAPYTKKIDSHYLHAQDAVAAASGGSGRSVFMTLCLAPRVMSSEKDLTYLLSKVDDWEVDGYYVIPERPDGDYLTDDPLWMANLLRLCAGLKLKGKQVIVGYASHQLLSLSCAGVDAIASGTWMNVRSFTMDKFLAYSKRDYAKRKAWYYCPQSLSEFSVQYLDIAHARQKLSAMRPMIEKCIPYAEMLFNGLKPSLCSFNESYAFKNYLVALASQCEEVSQGKSFSERYDKVIGLYRSAAELLAFLHKYEIRGQSRDFEDYVDVSISALDMFKEDHGFLLDHMSQCYCDCINVSA